MGLSPLRLERAARPLYQVHRCGANRCSMYDQFAMQRYHLQRACANCLSLLPDSFPSAPAWPRSPSWTCTPQSPGTSPCNPHHPTPELAPHRQQGGGLGMVMQCFMPCIRSTAASTGRVVGALRCSVPRLPAGCELASVPAHDGSCHVQAASDTLQRRAARVRPRHGDVAPGAAEADRSRCAPRRTWYSVAADLLPLGHAVEGYMKRLPSSREGVPAHPCMVPARYTVTWCPHSQYMLFPPSPPWYQSLTACIAAVNILCACPRRCLILPPDHVQGMRSSRRASCPASSAL